MLVHINKIISNGQKAIIFTEFVDTANYLAANLTWYKELTVTQKSTREFYDKMHVNFDACYLIDKRKNNYDILLATDCFTEGYSLNRTNHVLNFDIP